MDFVDAFVSIFLRNDERRFSCADTETCFIVWRVLGFGGKAFLLLFCRVASWRSRTSQAMFDENELRLQVYLDDPAVTVTGSQEVECARCDVLLLWWLVFGIPLAWDKGSFTNSRHGWIGIRFSNLPEGCSMELPTHNIAKTQSALTPLA